MSKEIDYFINELNGMEILKREGKDVGALVRNNVEKILWERVDEEIDEELEEKRRGITKRKVR